MTAPGRVWLTEDAHQRLRRELDHLRGSADASADGEFDQAIVVNADRRAARIDQIERILRNAVVGEAPPDDGVAEPGMVLTVRFDDTGETSTFLLGLRAAADDDSLDVYSPDSPLGAALLGAGQGDQRGYTVPNGATVRVTLLHAVPYGHHRAR